MNNNITANAGCKEERQFKPGDIVQHFKRETVSDNEKQQNKFLYEIIGKATDSETREKVMVYRALYDSKELFVRPYDMFISEVDHDKYPNIIQKYRFEIVEKLSE